MEIRRGWASDYAKRKFDITLDDEDLRRLIAARCGEADPEAVFAAMTVEDRYQVLDAEAMLFVSDTLRRFETRLEEAHAKAMSQHAGQRDAILAKYLPAPEKPAG